MKHLPLLLFAIASTLTTWAGNPLSLNLLDAPPTSETESFFAVQEGSVAVNGTVIREFAINGERVTVAYKNLGENAVTPTYMFRIYNRYGVLIGSDEVSSSLIGGSPRLEAGELGGDKLHVEWLDVREVFRHSTIGPIPDDFSEPAWISIADSNSELTTDGKGP